MDVALSTRIAGVAALALAGFAPVTPGDEDAATVPVVDLQRYAGTWHEQARLPNRFQKHCVRDVTATYTPQADGSIEVLNQCRRDDGSLVCGGGTWRHCAARHSADRRDAGRQGARPNAVVADYGVRRQRCRHD